VDGGGRLRQGVEVGQWLRGSVVTFSAWVNTGDAGAVRLEVSDYAGGSVETALSPHHSGSGDWEQLTVVKELRPDIAWQYSGFPHWFPVAVGFRVNETLATYTRVDNAMLVVGAFPDGVPFVPLPPGEDWARCERFYEKFGDLLVSTGNYDDYPNINIPILYQRKPGSPTVTISAGGGFYNDAWVLFPNPNCCSISIQPVPTYGDTRWDYGTVQIEYD